MKKFLVEYLFDVAVLDAWMQKPEGERKDAEAKMKGEWDAWVAAHPAVKVTEGVGKTKLVSKAGVSDTRNGLALYSIVEAESQDAAAEMFKDHPHLQIDGATIEVMEVFPLNR